MTIFSSIQTARGQPASFADNGSVAPQFSMLTWPSTLYDATANKTWSVWLEWASPNQRVYFNAFDHSTKAWVGQTFLCTCILSTQGDHGAPSILLDDSGFLHVFHSAFNAPIAHRVGNSSHSLSASTARPTFGTAPTYPCPVMMGSSAYVFCQELQSGDLNWGFYTTTFSGGVESGWSSWTQLINTVTGSERFYAGQPQKQGTKFHFPGGFSTTGVSSIKNCYYFIYDTADGSISNIDGSHVVAAASLPVSKADCDSFFKIFTSVLGGGDVPAICFDNSGNPHVLYEDGSGSSYHVYHRAYISNAWTTQHELGISVGPASKYAAIPNASGGVDCYFTQTTNRVLIKSDGTQHGAGDIYQSSRATSGSWTTPSLIQRQTQRNGGIVGLGDTVMVKDAHPDIRIVWSEKTNITNSDPSTDPTAGTLKLYAYGDSGFF